MHAVKKSKLYTINVTAQPQMLVPANINRVVLAFYPGAASYAINPNKPASMNDGIIIGGSFAPVIFDIERFGEIVQLDWWIFASATPGLFNYLEVLGP